MELRFHDNGLQIRLCHCLRDAIGHGRNTQRTRSAITFRDLDESHRRWKIAVHFRSSSRHIPDGLNGPPFPRTLTTRTLDPSSFEAVWDLILQPDPEGPTLISRAAKLHSSCHVITTS